MKIEDLFHTPKARVHFVGINGTGMSAYAWFRALGGGSVSGSDRSFDNDGSLDERTRFEDAGIAIYSQDGSGVEGAAALVASVSIEAQIPDIARAKELGIPVISRRDWLAALYRAKDCIAITGTSGKSTVTAMVFEIFKACGRDPGLITGADLASLVSEGRIGNAAVGKGPVILEADESDHGVRDYTPVISAILNLQRDHCEPAEILEDFALFKANTRQACILSDDTALDSLRAGAITASMPVDIVTTPRSVAFKWEGRAVTLPVPGAYNTFNACMALEVGKAAGLDADTMIAALADFKGVARRFNIIGAFNGVEVIDDYAHNPEKIRAALGAAQERSTRVVAVFQPHGFGPTRFMKDDLIAMFAQALRIQDTLVLTPIYYAGGTAAMDIASQDLTGPIAAQGFDAFTCDLENLAKKLPGLTKPGDCLLVMGARDPNLPAKIRALADSLI